MRWAWLGVLATLGCGEAAYDGNYEGEIVLELESFGPVQMGPIQLTHGIVALLWLSEDAGGEPVLVPAQIEVEERTMSATVRLRAEPDVDVLGVDLAKGRVVMGQLVRYDDVDADGQLDVGERIYALASRSVVLFSREGAVDPLFERPLAPGFQVHELGRCSDDYPYVVIGRPMPGAQEFHYVEEGLAPPFFPGGCFP